MDIWLKGRFIFRWGDMTKVQAWFTVCNSEEEILGSWCGGLLGCPLGVYDGYLLEGRPGVKTVFKDSNIVGL